MSTTNVSLKKNNTEKKNSLFHKRNNTHFILILIVITFLNHLLLLFCLPQLPKQPKWSGTWDAKFFRPACPQDLTELRKDIPDFPAQNVSEDCLYLNIFVPNVSIFRTF